MKPNDLTEALEKIGWSGRYLAAKLQCAPNTIVQMQHGLRSVPAAVEHYLRGLVAWHADNPAPVGAWRTRFDLAPQTKRAPKRAPRRKASSKGRG